MTFSGGTSSFGGSIHNVIGTDNGQKTALTVAGGSLTLTGVNDYTGPTMLSAGTLVVNGSLAATAVAVSTGATLTGSGSIGGHVAVATGGAIAGAANATLSIAGGLELDGGSSSDFAIGRTDAATAMVAVTGGLTGPTMGVHTINFTGNASLGTYDLFSFDSGSLALSQFATGTLPTGSYSYNLSIAGNQLDLIVANPNSSAVWNFNGSDVYGNSAQWSPQAFPTGAGQSATFGNGSGVTVNASSVTVTIDNAYTLGSLTFNNTLGTTYSLATDGVVGHGLTLNSGAGTSSSITVTTGSPIISTSLTLADAGGNAFVISPSTQLTVSGTISETGGSRAMSLSGGGTLTLSSANIYSGGTTVSAGTLRTTADGALGSGPLAVNSASGATLVNLQTNESIGGLSTTITGGTATVNVSAGKTLTVNPASGIVDPTAAASLWEAAGRPTREPCLPRPDLARKSSPPFRSLAIILP